MIQLKLNNQKVIAFLLEDKYLSEFEEIDGLNQHAEGLNFSEWLYKNELISKEDLERSLADMENEANREA